MMPRIVLYRDNRSAAVDQRIFEHAVSRGYLALCAHRMKNSLDLTFAAGLRQWSTRRAHHDRGDAVNKESNVRLDNYSNFVRVDWV